MGKKSSLVANPFLKSGALGAITAFSFAPFNVFPIFILTFGWLFVQIRKVDETKSLSFWMEIFCFFFCLHLACLYWVVYPLTLDLTKHAVLIPFAITLIPAYASAFLLIPTWILSRKSFFATASADIFVEPTAFALLFSLIMMFYGNFLPGFPWVLPGYIWCCHEIFLQTLSIYGIYGLSFVTMLIAGFLGQSFLYYRLKDTDRSRNSAIISILLLLFMVLYGYFRLARNPTIFTDKRIRLVQCNISQKDKNDSQRSFSDLKKHLVCSGHESKIDLIIWPEASIPYLYHENFKQLHDYLRSQLKESEYLLAGAVREDRRTKKIYNSAIAINHRGENIAIYDKMRLVPFGEYIPFRKYLPFKTIASDIGDFDRGELAKILEIGSIKVVIAICYEIIFPHGLITVETDGDNHGSKADLIVNLTNDGWFGYTSEPFQHLQIARARAVEAGVPLARATNNGITTVFDSYGREIVKMPIDQHGIIDVNVPARARSRWL
jgi:apolipoprotein N-acyltransferase